MGFYLNNKRPAANYRKVLQSAYFVDKTAMLEELFPLVEPDTEGADQGAACGRDIRYLCVTRPRRFGKTIMANMIASFFGKGEDTRWIFQNLAISGKKGYEAHLNRHNVIAITFNEKPKDCKSYRQYIGRIENRLLRDLMRSFPNAEITEEDALWDALNTIYELEESVEFIFVLDEWDYIYHQESATDAEKEEFTEFLSMLLKDQPYVEMAYMTGILPIAKYSSGSELNMFCEYTMVSEAKYSEYFGFTDGEVDRLFAKYQAQGLEIENITRDGLRLWYDGYCTKGGCRVYNPRSVVMALTNNNLGNYWVSSGPYDELFYYVSADVDAVKREVGLMIADIPVPAKVQEYAATSRELTTRDEIFSAMVVYGFLNYENGCVSIPNRELMDKFAQMVQRNYGGDSGVCPSYLS